MDRAAKRRILVLVEGKTETQVLDTLFAMYPELDAHYEPVEYRTNIYGLYHALFESGDDPDALDLLQVLKARERDPDKKRLFDDRYTDVLLIFDFEPHDPWFDEEKIRRMQAYFCESSDMGKLYVNYPMVESFYHMKEIPDPGYDARTCALSELQTKGSYKLRVRHACKRGKPLKKFITSRDECNAVIRQNVAKAFRLLGQAHAPSAQWVEVDMALLLERQIEHRRSGYVHVLCTCVLYVYDYNCAMLYP